ncbi:alpha/beta fold hydrolase [Dongia deserti]|uniref:alpha/beta fold hydrolase n=1 Tax=Dongia deserti TaxID=2268030 RepID=UPI000E6495C7|nr:alpha/beta hydrolase [Dongia deserti]
MLTEQSIRLPNGVALCYVEQGPAGAIPIILLHGYPDSWQSYEAVLAHMPRSIRVIALSQRGFGNSDKPAAGYHPRDLAADLAEFMKRRKIPEAVIVGHSMGALVAQRAALDFPELVAGLVLIGTFRKQADNAELNEMMSTLRRMTDPIELDVVRAFQASTLAQPVRDEFFKVVVAESARLPLRIWRAALKKLATYDDFVELSGISAPTLLYWGECDGFSTYEQQQEIARAIPDAELRVYAGAGHSLHWEEPKRFATDLVTFMNALGRRRLKGRARA